ncbi:MAG: serine/threonine protein kinase [Ardenticatenaceae bacterium]
MRPQRTHLLLVLITILTISTLASAFRSFTYWNEFTLKEAIDGGQVTAEIHGIAEDARFEEPMLAVSLSKQTIWPFTVVIPQGLRLAAASGESEVIVLQTERIALVLPQDATRLLGYSLDYSQPFPDSSTEYQINKVEQNEQWISILKRILSLEAEEELASQLAVWMTVQDVELKEIENRLNADFSEYSDRVNEIVKDGTDPVAPLLSEFGRWLLLTSIFSALTLALLHIWRKKRTPEPVNGSHKAPPIKQLELEDWKHLTTGGMAEIWTAYDKRSGKKVIVKFPKTDLEPRGINSRTIMARFENESTYHEMMDHENVVKLIESGSCDHPEKGHVTKYLILEFIEGKTIHELISDHRHNPFPVDAMIEVVRQITSALTHIHQKKVVHRDITSNNIMVDQSGRAHLIDFGNATDFDSEKTGRMRLQSVGTRPFYPLGYENVGTFPPYDYYSLAVLLYAMYTGIRVVGRRQADVKEEIREWYDENSSAAPMVVRKALAWYLGGKYSDNQEDSEQIREEHFPSARQILAELVSAVASRE